MTKLLQCLRDELVRRDYAATTIRSYIQIVEAVKHSLGDPRPSKHVYVPLGQHYESAMTLQIRLVGKRRVSTDRDPARPRGSR